MSKRSLLALGTAALLTAAPALAQVSATAATDLNLRAGPGPSYEIVGVIPAAGEVSVDGCLETENWCQVTFEGTTAWAYGDYLTAMMEDQPMVVYENRAPLQIGTVTYETASGATDGEAAAGGAAAGAMVAAVLVGGPAAIAAGALIGAGGAAAVNPDDVTVTYVRENPMETVYLGGEVIVGAGIPQEVTLSEVPESEYSYAYVNGVPVLVQRDNRQIVYVVR